MRNKFDRQLEELNNNLTMMGVLCENAISLAVKSFLDRNLEFAAQAMETEDEINSMEKKIENQCLQLLLQQQPVAKDLRVISAALKMITDIERIGDQAYDIAELSVHICKPDAPQIAHIKQMAVEAVKMVSDSINSFVKRDLELARQVMAYDDVVDELFNQAKLDIIKLIKEEKYDSEAVVDILMIAKYLERIADHAVNISEWVEFSITGKHKEEQV